MTSAWHSTSVGPCTASPPTEKIPLSRGITTCCGSVPDRVSAQAVGLSPRMNAAPRMLTLWPAAIGAPKRRIPKGTSTGTTGRTSIAPSSQFTLRRYIFCHFPPSSSPAAPVARRCNERCTTRASTGSPRVMLRISSSGEMGTPLGHGRMVVGAGWQPYIRETVNVGTGGLDEADDPVHGLMAVSMISFVCSIMVRIFHAS
jgi:hypothetical protein